MTMHQVLLIAIVLGLLRGIWFLAVQTTRFTASADAAAPADAPQDIIASKVHKVSTVISSQYHLHISKIPP